MTRDTRRRTICLLGALFVIWAGADAARGAEPLPPSGPDAQPGQASTIALQPSPGAGERTRFETTSDPGDRIEDGVEVMNLGTEPVEVRLEAVDARTTVDGAYALAAVGEPATDAASWVTFAEGDHAQPLRLAGGEGRSVDFAIEVPTNATPGDHAGAIVAARLVSEDPTAQITLHQRVALRLIVHVRGALHPGLSPSDLHAAVHGADPFMREATVVFDIANEGNVALRAAVAATATGPFSIPLGATSTETDLILPGEHATVDVALEFVALGPTTIAVEVQPFADADAPDPGPIATTRLDAFVGVVPPWGGLAIAVVVAAAIAIAVLLRQRSKRRFARAVDAAVARRISTAPPTVAASPTAADR